MFADTRRNALYTVDQVRSIDRIAIERLGIPAFELMQRAAAAAFASLRRRWPKARRIVLLAGNGNNGGDAFLLGSMALRAGFEVEAVTLAAQSAGDAQRARVAFAAAGGRIHVAGADTVVPAADVCIDGLFGSGLKRPVDGVAAALIDQLRDGCAVFALDVPSGLDADRGMHAGPCVRAHATISFVAWKRGLFTADGVDACGTLELAPLDLPEAAFADSVADGELIDDSIAGLLAPRRNNVNKSDFGHVLAIGGNAGMGGAIRLCGEAALRCGAGLVSVATRAANMSALNAARPELMACGIDDDALALAPLLQRATVIAVGPGLGQDAWGRMLFHAALGAGKPLVIDADALNLLAQQPRTLSMPCVLTPHPGEAARLLGCDTAMIQHDRFAAARALAARHAAVVVLKGAGTVIADSHGRIAACPWGNPGMASGGMGDLLTGVVAALLAQGLSSWDAARLAVALHARAGDVAAGVEQRGLLASDLFAPLRTLANGRWR